ncbi:dihydrofolate reductase family protein [Kribbella sp. NBC_01245]|uniref:dihydrofolate reductase family protein n=1 Tax=Kribbella sp. NBC_01245 TaxID=2903578 RepID=UPI002E27EE06|nr:dihydrofolate reductase family protein [Kribbella sp. NBC_01245]
MAKLIYSTIGSLDGYVADETGNFDWAAPDDDVHGFVNELMRPLGTYLYGRGMYDVLRFWETAEGLPPVEQEFAAIWQGADKVVYSSTLPENEVRTKRTRLEREFDPAAVRRLKETAGADLAIGGPHLAAQALKAGLVDELQLFLVPAIVGGGNQSLPDDLRLDLTLLDERRINQTIYLHYRVNH